VKIKSNEARNACPCTLGGKIIFFRKKRGYHKKRRGQAPSKAVGPQRGVSVKERSEGIPNEGNCRKKMRKESKKKGESIDFKFRRGRAKCVKLFFIS